MSYAITSQNGHTSYGVKEFVIDKKQDLEAFENSIDINTAPGSTVFIVETSEVYMLNNKKEWVEI